MKLETVLELIDRDLDGDLTPSEDARLHAFLERHSDWKRYRDSMERLDRAARSTPLIHPSPGFADRVMGRISEESYVVHSVRTSRMARPRRGSQRTVLQLAASAGLVAAMVLAAANYVPVESDAINGLVTASMQVVESIGTGIANLLADPLAGLGGLVAPGSATGWSVAILCVTVAIAVNLLYGKKVHHG